jgi:hypothetical protein
MDRLMPTDELNTLRMKIDADFRGSVEQRRQRKEKRIDEILELLILAYMYGNEAGNDMLFGSDFIESLGFTFGGTEQGAPDQPNRVIEIDPDSMNEAVFRKIADKDWRQRVSEYFDSENGTADDVFRVVDTDAHRVYNDAILNVGERADTPDSPVKKQWVTMLDDRVRDTHEYLEGMTVPVNSRFYTFDNDSARYPGDFTLPQNNINCRCRIYLTR